MSILRHQVICDRTCIDIGTGDIAIIEHFGPLPPDVLQRLHIELAAYHDAVIRLQQDDPNTHIRATWVGPQSNAEKIH